MTLSSPDPGATAERKGRDPAPAGVPRRRPSLLRTSTFRLTVFYLVIFSISAAVLVGVLFERTVGQKLRQVRSELAADATRFAAISGGEAATQARALVALLHQNDPSRLMLLVDSDGRKIAGNLPRWPELNGRISGSSEWLEPGAEDDLEVIFEVAMIAGFGRVLLARDIEELAEQQETFLQALGWVLLSTILLGGLGGLAVSAITVRRFERINRALQDIVGGDMSRRIPVRGSDDVNDLARRLNEMLDRIAELVQGLRQVSSDIAHDLRTPLTRLHSRLAGIERLERSEARQSEAVLAEVQAAESEVDGLLAMFDSVLRIARVNAGALATPMDSLDLAELLRDAVDFHMPVAEEKAISLAMDLRSQPDVDLCTEGDRELLFSAVANLIDNAIKYTPPQGRIRVGLRAHEHDAKGSMLVIEVADNGPGIPAEERSVVTRRFTRLAQDRGSPGHGLGLSLVEAVARYHGGRLQLEDNHPGLRARLVVAHQSAGRRRSSPLGPC